MLACTAWFGHFARVAGRFAMPKFEQARRARGVHTKMFDGEVAVHDQAAMMRQLHG